MSIYGQAKGLLNESLADKTGHHTCILKNHITKSAVYSRKGYTMVSDTFTAYIAYNLLSNKSCRPLSIPQGSIITKTY